MVFSQHGLHLFIPPACLQVAIARTQLLQHCCTALHKDLANPAPASSSAATSAAVSQRSSDQPQHHNTAAATAATTPSAGLPTQQGLVVMRRLLLFNLFALEGYSIAEALQVPCCVLQPYLVPYSMPSGFKRRFEAAAPSLVAQLQAADAAASATDASASAAAAAAAGAEPDAAASPGRCFPSVCWKDVSTFGGVTSADT